MSDEERDLRKYSRRSAIGLMGVGGGLAATETLGFTNLTADRGVDVDVENDLNADLKIAGEDSGGDGDETKLENFDSGNRATPDLVITFTNNAGGDVDIEADDLTIQIDDVGAAELSLSSDDFSADNFDQELNNDNTLPDGDSAEITVENTNTDNQGEINLTVVEAVLNGVTITNLERNGILIDSAEEEGG